MCINGVVYCLELSMFCFEKFGLIRKFDGSVWICRLYICCRVTSVRLTFDGYVAELRKCLIILLGCMN